MSPSFMQTSVFWSRKKKFHKEALALPSSLPYPYQNAGSWLALSYMRCYAMRCDVMTKPSRTLSSVIVNEQILVIIHMDISVLFSTIVCSSSDQKSSLADWLLVFLLVPRHHHLVLWWTPYLSHLIPDCLSSDWFSGFVSAHSRDYRAALNPHPMN